MRTPNEKRDGRDLHVLGDCGGDDLMAICTRVLRVGLMIVLVLAISSSVSSVTARALPTECPSGTAPLPVAITLSVTLQRPNAPAPDPSWAVPVHFSLHPPGLPDLVCWEWDLTLDQSGDWSGNLTFFTGLYDVRVKNMHTLRNVDYNLNIAGPMTIDMGELIEGDASDNNFVKGEDFSILRTAYWTQQGQPGFDPRADFDEDDWVKGSDFSLLRTNYWTQGDIEVP